MSKGMRLLLSLVIAVLLYAPMAMFEGASVGTAMSGASVGNEESRPLNPIVIDVTGSTQTTDPTCLSISTARMTVDLLTPGRVAIITFAGDAATLLGTFDLASPLERQAAQQALDELQAKCSSREGATPLADALDLARSVLDREKAPAGSTVYLLTDGKPEPDTEQQYEAIRTLAPRFKERGWRVAAVGLEQPGDPWVRDLALALSAAEPVIYSADSMSEVRDYFLALYQQVTGQTTVNLQDGRISPTVGAVEVPLKIDPTMREVTLIAFHDEPARLRLFAPDGTEIGPGDPRVGKPSADDPHYALIQLSGELPSGQWRAVIEGSGSIGLRAVYRSSLTLDVIAPTAGGLLPLNAPGDIQARLLDAETGDIVFEPATVVAELHDAAGGISSVELKDDGNAATGDAAKSDGIYSGRLVLSTAGQAQLLVRADSRSFSLNSRTAISVESFPSLFLKGTTVFSGIKRGSSVDMALSLQVDGAPYDSKFMDSAQATVLKPNGDVVASDIAATSMKGDRIVFRTKPEEGAAGDSAQYVLSVRYSGTYRGSPFTFVYASPVLQFYLVPPTTPWRLYGSLMAAAVLALASTWAGANYWRRPRRTRAGFVEPLSSRNAGRISLQPALRRLSIVSSLLLGRYVAQSRIVPGLPDGLLFRFGRNGEVFVRRCLAGGKQIAVRTPGGSEAPLGRRWRRLRAGDRLTRWGRDIEFRPA